MLISGDTELHNGGPGNVTQIPYDNHFDAYKQYLICTWDNEGVDTPALVRLWKARVFPNILSEAAAGTTTTDTSSSTTSHLPEENDVDVMIARMQVRSARPVSPASVAAAAASTSSFNSRGDSVPPTDMRADQQWSSLDRFALEEEEDEEDADSIVAASLGKQPAISLLLLN